MDERTANPAAPALSALELTGRARSHVRDYADLQCTLHPQAAAALRAMRAAAADAGFDLQAVSGFRDFERQRTIWNGKFRGERPLLDARGRPLDAAALGAAERVAAILVWSALPGASRHHWGSDCDVIDRAALPEGAPVVLESADYARGGRYERLDRWLARHAGNYGFFRPYDADRGGVQPEPWHLSYAPVAGPALAALTPELLRAALAGCELEGREAVEAQLPQLHARYVAAVAEFNPAARPA